MHGRGGSAEVGLYAMMIVAVVEDHAAGLDGEWVGT